MNRQGRQHSITLFESFTKQLADKLWKKAQWFFLPLLYGALLAIARRRTVTTWLRAAQLSDDYRSVFYPMPDIGRKSNDLLDTMAHIITGELRVILETATYIRIVLDDSPTKRYGKHIEGANYHHNPTPGKTDAKFCYGHSWVVAALVITHPAFGEISFPIAAELYLRQIDIDKRERLPIGGEHALAGDTGFSGKSRRKTVSEGDIWVAEMCDGGGRPHLGGYSGERRVSPTLSFQGKNREILENAVQRPPPIGNQPPPNGKRSQKTVLRRSALT
jgi:hypothetical protein